MDQPLVLHALTICRRETDAMILCLGRRRQPPNRTIRVIQMSFFAASARWKNCVFWILSCQRQRVHNDQQQSDASTRVLFCVVSISLLERRAGRPPPTGALVFGARKMCCLGRTTHYWCDCTVSPHSFSVISLLY